MERFRLLHPVASLRSLNPNVRSLGSAVLIKVLTELARAGAPDRHFA